GGDPIPARDARDRTKRFASSAGRDVAVPDGRARDVQPGRLESLARGARWVARSTPGGRRRWTDHRDRPKKAHGRPYRSEHVQGRRSPPVPRTSVWHRAGGTV